ncbi:MAG: TolC family protein [Acidobacteria bacterium]|nr:MAG: TolC family protein [Acidobacteriota bacterium]
MRECCEDRPVGQWRWIGFAVVGCLLTPWRAGAQPAASGPLSLNDAVQFALKNYPAIKESRARAQAADEGIGVARTAYLPRLDMLWQENRATTNNVFGLVLPQSIVPPISGPVLGTRSYDSVWGSAAGVQLSWEALDFGQRKANVEVARAQSSFAKAQTDLTALDVAAAAADAFVTVLAADEAVRAARANVDRLQVFANNVRTLVANQLRPGADESRANAELAIARNQVSQAVQVADIARAALADAVGAAGTTVEPAMGSLANLPQMPSLSAGDFTSHPAARAELAVVDTVRARERVLDRSYFPHIYFQSGFAARDSGAQAPGLPPPGSGLWPQVRNWGAALQVTFPAFDLFTVNAHKRVEVQNELAERARYDLTIQTLTTQDARARALMKAAVDIAQNTPIERQAATAAESQARARYGSGLTSVTEVAEAQRLLAQAEADDAVARLGVWRALLAAAQVRGDLTPFLDQVRQP